MCLKRRDNQPTQWDVVFLTYLTFWPINTAETIFESNSNINQRGRPLPNK